MPKYNVDVEADKSGARLNFEAVSEESAREKAEEWLEQHPPENGKAKYTIKSITLQTPPAETPEA